MDMKQQTAVEWLINELSKTRDYQRVINEINQKSTSVRDIIAEAKEMEKEQIMDAWNLGRRDIDYFANGEQYYKEIYE